MCVIDRNTANGPTLMLPSAATHAEEVGAKICAPKMAAPQTDAYLALRLISKTIDISNSLTGPLYVFQMSLKSLSHVSQMSFNHLLNVFHISKISFHMTCWWSVVHRNASTIYITFRFKNYDFFLIGKR